MEAKHTPAPWVIVTGRATIGGHGHTVWMLGTADDSTQGIGTAVVILPDEDDTPSARAERQATAEFICRTVNCHAELLEALKYIRSWCIPGMNWTDEIGKALLGQADAAIAKATGA